jgi:carbon-monoxide dehydrogenase iron sulfur subunit
MDRIWVDKDKCLGCKSCELACAVERDSVSKALISAVAETPKPIARVGVFGPTGNSFPIPCRHCQVSLGSNAARSGAGHRVC